MKTWPLWKCLPVKALAELVLLQWKTYGTKLALLADIYRDVEDAEEIDRLMREPTHPEGKVWQGG